MIFNKFSHSLMIFDYFVCMDICSRAFTRALTEGKENQPTHDRLFVHYFLLCCTLVMLFTWFTFYRWFSTISCIYYLNFDHSFITRLDSESRRVQWIYVYDTVDGNNRCEIVTQFCAPQFIIHILSTMAEPNENQLRAQRKSSFTFINDQYSFSLRLRFYHYVGLDWHMTSHDMI